MSILLLPTKMYLPRLRAGAISRPRLIEKLLDGMRRPGSFVLLSSPAGFGKTTLLAEFSGRLEHSPAWVSLDEGDNDPKRFWSYLIHACQSVQPAIGQNALALLQATQPLPDETLPSLLIQEFVQLQDDLVLVLDDYHSIQNPAIQAGMSFLLEHLSERFHLIVSTRSDPPWPLARFRARDRLEEIRAADLRFTSEECHAFLNQVMGLKLSPQQTAGLEARTEGWAASLQLAALSMRGRSDVSTFIQAFTGSHLYVAEYLIEEVLDRQTEETRSFLLQTSILERLTAGLCEAVSGYKGVQSLLMDLYQANLFLVPLDDEGQWFRYHPLFADLLQSQLPQAVPAEEIASLHRRAADWFERNGASGEAIGHFLIAQDFESTARLVEDHGYQTLIRGELTTLLHWIKALPGDVIRRHPLILIQNAWALTLAGAFHQVEPLLQQAETQADLKSADALELSGNAAAMRAFFAMMMGDYPRALELAERAEALLPQGRAHVSWLVPFTLGAVHRSQGRYEKAVEEFNRQALLAEKTDNLILWVTGLTEVAIVRRLQGRLREAAETCCLALQRLEERGAVSFGSLAKLEVPLIEVLREQNELSEAYRRVSDVLRRMESWPMPTDRIFALLAKLHVQQSQGNTSGALESLQAAREVKASQPVLVNLARAVDLGEVQLMLKTGVVDAAARRLEEIKPGTSRVVSLYEQEMLVLARLRLGQNKTEEAESIVSRLAAEAEAGERIGALIEILVLQAIVMTARGDRGRALPALIKALKLGEPEGFVRVFVDEGEPMRSLLTSITGQAADKLSANLKEYTARLLDAFPGLPARDDTPPLPSPGDRLIEPLTRRELEVLHLIDEGHSNQAIADRLVITLSAVKKHTGNIFGKLNVNSRTQALARARQLGLISFPADR